MKLKQQKKESVDYYKSIIGSYFRLRNKFASRTAETVENLKKE